MRVSCIECNSPFESEFMSKSQEISQRCITCDEMSYTHRYSLKLLNRIINERIDLTPNTIINERYEIDGELYAEIFNFLQNNSLDNFK